MIKKVYPQRQSKPLLSTYGRPCHWKKSLLDKSNCLKYELVACQRILSTRNSNSIGEDMKKAVKHCLATGHLMLKMMTIVIISECMPKGTVQNNILQF